MKKTKVNQGKDIYDEKRQRNTMQKEERKKRWWWKNAQLIRMIF